MNASTRRRLRSGFSLIEMVMVVAIIGILAAVIIPRSNPSIYDQLQSVAGQMAGDIGYARNLAVVGNSNYRFSFDTDLNRYVLTHSGTNAALNNLPPSPLRSSSDPPDQQIVELDKLLPGAARVRIHQLYALSTPAQTVTTIEFGPLGETTRSEETVVWLSAGGNGSARYLPVRVSAVTGLVRIGALTAEAPTIATAAGG